MMGFWRRYRRNRGAVIGLALLLLVTLVAALAPFVYPAGPWDMAGAPFQRPFSQEFPFGTDMLGRDITAGIAHGARVSLMLGVISTLAALSLGILLGAFAGYYGGVVD